MDPESLLLKQNLLLKLASNLAQLLFAMLGEHGFPLSAPVLKQ